MFFAAPWDRRLRIATRAVVAFLCVEFIGITVVLFLTNTQRTALAVGTMFCVMNALIIAFTSSYAPRGFLVDETGVTVVRKISPVHIERNAIRRVTHIEADRFMKSTRVWGNGGLFGYYGSFRNKALGNFKMFATNRGNGILIEGDTTYVITPERPDEFVDVLTSYLPD